ncbi:hypothetical protein BDF19DRAFT_450701 [Syncephalis fuscata]|nr:hypothetical protein BDF19DRAFT_450701 [Syncephalis fuscata]
MHKRAWSLRVRRFIDFTQSTKFSKRKVFSPLPSPLSFSVVYPPPPPMEPSTLSIKVEIFRGQKHDTFIASVPLDTTVRQAIETVMFFNEVNTKWLIDWSRLNAYSTDILNALMLRVKSPEYHDQEAQSINNQTLMYTTGRPPIITVHQLPMINEHSGTNSNHRFLSSISGLFVKNEKRTLDSKIRNRRLYLAVLLFAGDGRVLITREGLLPTVCINSNNEALCRDLESNSEEFRWMLRDALDWERGVDKHHGISLIQAQSRRSHHRATHSARVITRRRKLQSLVSNSFNGFGDAANQHDFNTANFNNATATNAEEARWRDAERAVREDFAVAAAELRRLLRLPTLGLVAPDAVRTGLLRWRDRDQMDKNIYEWQEDLWWRYQCAYNGRLSRLAGGLYVAVFYAEIRCTFFLPVFKIRNNTSLTNDELEWLDNLSGELDSMPNEDTEPLVAPDKSTKSGSASSSIAQSKERSELTSIAEENIDCVDFCSAFTRSYYGLQRAVRMGWRTKDIYLKRCITLDNEGNLKFDDDFRRSTAARVILIVKPMRPAQNQSTESHESGDFEMFPLALFEMLHQQTYSTGESCQVREKTQKKRQILRRLLNASNGPSPAPRNNPAHRRRATLPRDTSESLTDDEQMAENNSKADKNNKSNNTITKNETASSDSINSIASSNTATQIANIELAIGQYEEELATLRRQTSDSLWTRRVITWDRDRAFRRTMMLASPSVSNGSGGSDLSYLSGPPSIQKLPLRNSVSATMSMSMTQHLHISKYAD